MPARSAFTIRRLGRPTLLAIGLAFLLPAAAPAAVTVGSSLPEPTGETLECTDPGGCTFVPTKISGSQVAVPADGVIVSWAARFPGGGTPSFVNFRVLRPAPGGELTGVDRTLSEMPAPDGAITEFPDRVPVRAGDLIGVDLAPDEELGIAAHTTLDSESSSFVPRLGNGETRAPTDSGPDDFEALFNARIEPDADGDGHGDETQDLCPQRADTYRHRCSILLGASLVSLTHRDPLTIVAGDEFRIRAVARNFGSDSLPDVVLTLAPPPEVSVVAVAAPCTLDSGRITCPFGSMAGRSEAGVDITLRAIRPATGPCFPFGPLWCVTIRADVTGGRPALPGNPRAKLVRILAAGPCSNSPVPLPGSEFKVTGTIAGDRMLGGARGDTLLGEAGDDCLLGKGGDDLLRAGDGDDRLGGGPGRDSLFGDAGDDRLTGGPRRDRLYGGPGTDIVHAVDGQRDIVRCGPGRDVARVDTVDSVARCERVRRVPKRRR